MLTTREGVRYSSAPLRSRSSSPSVSAASAAMWLTAMVRSYPSGDSALLRNAVPVHQSVKSLRRGLVHSVDQFPNTRQRSEVCGYGQVPVAGVAVGDQQVYSVSGLVGTADVHQHSRPTVPNTLGRLMADTALGAGAEHGLSVQPTGELSVELAHGLSLKDV